MEQSNMSMDTFSEIIRDVKPGTTIHLQGEGEPLLHPNFNEMVSMCRTRELRVSTITNGTVPYDINLIDKLHVSVDSLDITVNNNAGRGHFDKTLRNLYDWIAIAPSKIVIRVTDYGQDVTDVLKFCNDYGLQRIIQPLNSKDEYRIGPSDVSVIKVLNIEPASIDCALLRNGAYYTTSGLKLPCCFIKFPKETYSEIIYKFNHNVIPDSCSGCSNIQRYY